MSDLFREISEPQQSTLGAQNPYAIEAASPARSALHHIVRPGRNGSAVQTDLPEHTAKPQPGLILGALMTLGFPTSQIFTAIPPLIIVAVMSRSGKVSHATELTTLLAGSQAGVLLLAIGAIVFCSWLAKHKVLDFAPIRLLHLMALVGVILPTTIFSRGCYDVAVMGWARLVELFPGFGVLDSMNTMSQVGDIVSTVPFGFVLFGMAIVPALAEEIIFRGIIGRGLKAQYGLVSGIILTSILFGIAHVHPAHAASVIPLGIMFHVLYVTTRSFWAPVLAHFFNNAFAVVGAKVALQQGQAINVDQAPALPWWLAAAALLSVVAWFTLLFKTRTRLTTDNGKEWSPGYESTEVPRHIPTRRWYPEMPIGATVAAILCGGLFFAAFFGFAVVEGMENMQSTPEAMLLMLRR